MRQHITWIGDDISCMRIVVIIENLSEITAGSPIRIAMITYYLSLLIIYIATSTSCCGV